MTMTDPIADMLTRIRNGNVQYHDVVRMPSSKQKEALAVILQQEGFIAGFRVKDNEGRPGRTLEIDMKYLNDRTRSILGLRVYSQADKLPRVLGGLGVAVLSTSHGLMTDKEAHKRRVGGEVLCYVW